MVRTLLQHAVEWVKMATEIGLLAVLIYLALQFVRGTRAVAILAGITILSLGLSVLSRTFDLEVIGWLVDRMWAVLAFTAVIVFQPEVRRALSEVGLRRGFLRSNWDETRAMDLVGTLVDATFFLADRRVGALIAIEQSIGLRTYAETGTQVEAAATSKLISSIFFPNTPLHDGGVIVRQDRLVAAGCIFPLSQNPDLGKTLGTRHRAAVGLTEETDAIVIVVSEESGAVSLARGGRLSRGVARDRLRRHLNNYLVKKQHARRTGDLFGREARRNEPETAAAGES
jgi:diadenylate cyclase